MSKLKVFLTKDLGFALPTVVLFIFVMTLSATAFFSMASYESRSALNWQHSTEAFYLADGGISRALVMLAADKDWREGYSDVVLGNGSYTLSLVDTTFAGSSSVVQVVSTAQVGQSRRGIELMVDMGGDAFTGALSVVGDLEVRGNICIDGDAVIGGVADFGHHDVHLHCGGTYVDGVPVTVPHIYTEPQYYPDATYYYVVGNQIGGVDQARILDRYGNDITSALGDSLVGFASYDAGDDAFTYTFDKSSEISQYFDDSGGVFSRAAGDQAVVVNFNQPSMISASSVSCVVLKGNSGTPVINATIINSRFVGTSAEQRADTNYWRGGYIEGKKVIFEPYYGISVVCHEFLQSSGALLEMGTDRIPALTYITGDAEDFGSNFMAVGQIVVLGDWDTRGGPEIYHNPDFEDVLPWYFFDEELNGHIGGTETLRWREIACGN